MDNSLWCFNIFMGSDKMIITRISPFSGESRSMNLPVTQDELDRWLNGELIQNVFPHLDENEREFIMTGITSEEWDNAFGKTD